MTTEHSIKGLTLQDVFNQ